MLRTHHHLVNWRMERVNPGTTRQLIRLEPPPAMPSIDFSLIPPPPYLPSTSHHHPSPYHSSIPSSPHPTPPPCPRTSSSSTLTGPSWTRTRTAGSSRCSTPASAAPCRTARARAASACLMLCAWSCPSAHSFSVSSAFSVCGERRAASGDVAYAACVKLSHVRQLRASLLACSLATRFLARRIVSSHQPGSLAAPILLDHAPVFNMLTRQRPDDGGSLQCGIQEGAGPRRAPPAPCCA